MYLGPDRGFVLVPGMRQVQLFAVVQKSISA